MTVRERRFRRRILPHQAYPDLPIRKSCSNLSQQCHGGMPLSGKNQMPNQNTVLQNAMVQNGRSHLPYHLRNCLLGYGAIVRNAAVLLGGCVVHILPVRQVNIHQPIQQGQNFRRIIAAAVPDHWNVQLRCYLLQTLCNPRGIMRTRHQIQCFRSLLLQAEKNFR